MNLIHFAIGSGIHNKKKTLLNLLICMIIVILINVFVGNLASIKEQITTLPDVIKVNAVISNLNGSLTSGITIPEKYVNGVLRSEYVADPVFTVQLKMGFGEFGAEECEDKLVFNGTSCNNIEGVPGLHEDEVSLMKGMDSGAFFSSADKLCVVDEKVFEDNNLAIGDKVTMTYYYFRYAEYHQIFCEPFDTDEYTVVGTMNIMEYKGDSARPDVVVPLETVRNIYKDNGFEFSADSGSFKVKDPYKLNAFKDQMHEIGLLPVIFPAEFQYDGNALTVRDETFKHSSEQLFKSESTMERMLPFLGVAVLCIGFVLAELLMKGRIYEYAIMRSLGQKHGESIGIMCIEYALTALAGSIPGSLAGIFIVGTAPGMASIAAGVFIICYVIGALAALWSLKRLSIMSVLSRND